MPLPSIWGPLAWKILHGIGVKAGKIQNQKMRADENREALWLISHLEYIIPCPECRQHILAYRKKNGLPSSSNEIGRWLFFFHNIVNERLGKNKVEEFIDDLGKVSNLGNLWKEYLECVKESFQIGHLNANDVREWSRHFYLWLATA
jgi:hypothetical protein